MNRQQENWIARNPKALLDYQLRNRLPRTYTPSSPLITLLESISPRERLRMCGVRLSPALGYNSQAQFHTAEQLLRYLKPKPIMVEAESCPAESCRIKSYSKRVTLDDLKAHCASWPY